MEGEDEDGTEMAMMPIREKIRVEEARVHGVS